MIDDDRVDADRLVRASAGVAVATLLSRLTGLLRVAVLAYALGRASFADTYNLANTTPNIVYELLIGGVLTATLVPLFVQHLHDRDERATNVVFTAVVAALVVLTIAAIVAAPLIARLYTFRAPAADREAQEAVATLLIRLFMPQMAAYGFTALAAAALNARRRFAAAAYAPVLNNVVVISSLLTFAAITSADRRAYTEVGRIRDETGLLLLVGLGTTAGILAMALVLVPALRHAGVHLRPVLDLRHAALRRVARLSGWTVGYVVSNQLALLVVLVLASKRSGDVSAYQYAFIFFQLPHGLLAVSIMTTATPELARRAAARDEVGLRDQFSLGMRSILVVIAPAAAAYLVLAQPAVAVLVRGGFSVADARTTADTLQLLATGLVPFSVYLFVLRGFYALQDTRTPFFLNVFENGINIALAVALFPELGVQGLALAYALAYTIAAVGALALFQRRVVGFGRDVVVTGARATLAAGALAAVAAPVAGAIGADGAGAAAGAAVAAGGAGALVYVVALRLLGASELAAFRALVRRRTFTRVGRVQR